MRDATVESAMDQAMPQPAGKASDATDWYLNRQIDEETISGRAQALGMAIQVGGTDAAILSRAASFSRFLFTGKVPAQPELTAQAASVTDAAG